MALRTFETFGNGQSGTPRDFTVGYFATLKMLPLSGGGWVFVGKTDTGPNQGAVVAQTFDSAGTQVGGEVVLVTGADFPDAGFYLADAALLSDGKLAVSLGVNRGNTDFSSTPVDVFTRVFAAGSYAALGAAVQADTGQDGQEYAGAISALPDGGFAVIWRDGYTSHDGTQRATGAPDSTYAQQSDMWVRVFNGNGAPRDQPYLAQGASDPDLAFPQGAFAQDLAALSGGRVVTAFSDTEIRRFGGGSGVEPGYTQVVGDSFHISTGTGAPLGGANEFDIGAMFSNPFHDNEGAGARPVQIVATPDGGFTAVFSETYIIRGEYGSVARTEYYLKAQHYTADGAASGGEAVLDFLPDDTLGGSLQATLMRDGRIVIAYAREFGHYPNNDAGVQLLQLNPDLSISQAGRIATSGQNTVFDLTQDADGTLLVTLGGGSASLVARVVDADATAVLQSGAASGETLTGGAVGDWLNGRAGDDALAGLAGDDHLYGAAGADALSGGAGSDYLQGGSGDDRLDGGAGINRLDGGAGIDFADYAARTSALYVDMANGAYSTPDTYDIFVSIEGVIGGSGNDQLLGGSGADRLQGGAGSDVLTGRGGDDLLAGGVGINQLDGGAGTDLADYSAQSGGLYVDLTYGAYSTADTYDRFISIEGVMGGSGSDQLLGTTADDVLAGGAGNDVLIGREGNDRLAGGTGANDLQGGEGFDFADYGAQAAGVYVDLDQGYYSNGADSYDQFGSIEGAFGGSGSDFLLGTAGNNALVGGSGDDVLIGRDGADALNGGDGADRLIGGSGDDVLIGGTGGDVFDLASGVTAGTANTDTAQDFSRFDDRIYLGGSAFIAVAVGDYNGDGVSDTRLTWDGGAFIALGVSALSLNDWNGLLV